MGLFLKTNSGVAGSYKVEKFVTVFADERFDVVASNIVPFDSIIVEVVQNGQARFIITLLIKKNNVKYFHCR